MRALTVIFFMAIAGAASGQYYDKLYLVDWSINKPLSNTEFVGNTSVRGGRLGFRQLINEHIGVGLDANWSVYDDYIARQTYYSDNGALTTDFFKYVETYSATFVTDYYFFSDQKFMPYVGLGIGGGYNNYKLYYNMFTSGSGTWGLVLRPQTGAWMRLGDRSTWALHGSVNFGFSTAGNKDMDYKNFSNLGFQIGLVKLDW